MGISLLPLTDPYRRPDGTLKHDTKSGHQGKIRESGTQEWIGVDGEGVTLPNGEHRYVLFGMGHEQIEDPNGLEWETILEFIAARAKPGQAIVGFFLGYDFTQWIKTMPESRARALLTIDGKAKRKSKSKSLRGKYLPVDIGQWQIDILGAKRFQFRRKPCDCQTFICKCDCPREKVRPEGRPGKQHHTEDCPHKRGPWVYVCDAGPFFQTSFLNVINPEHWQTPIVSPEEYATILEGKAKRESAELDDDMRRYNRLENEVLARVMQDLDTGLRRMDVKLTPAQWFGPGQAAQSWLHGRIPTREDTEKVVPDWFREAAWSAYFGGWFEIMAHGHIRGTSHEYDLNSAYPAIIASLPCLLHGGYSRGQGELPPSLSGFTLVRADVIGGDTPIPIGAMLHRNPRGWISRPMRTAGWYWLHELDSAVEAGLVETVEIHEWAHYTPCDCKPPLWQIANLYQMRLDVGKTSTLGKAAKLIYNSIYGKFAQTVGYPMFGNPVYASLITSGCRTMILDAIASHEKGAYGVLMVATDAIFFDSPNEDLPLSDKLGEWDYQERQNLTLFKPGVYWDDKARRELHAGRHVNFKARGVNAQAFAKQIELVDYLWGIYNGHSRQWPEIRYKSGFAMTTALQALARGKWETAGYVDQAGMVKQSSTPYQKRLPRAQFIDGRWLTGPHPYGIGSHPEEGDYASCPYTKRYGEDDPFSDESMEQWGISPDEPRIGLNMFRLLSGQD